MLKSLLDVTIFSIAPIAASIKVKVERWDNEIIDLITASTEDIKDFLDTKFYLYSTERISDYNLWTAFRIDFKPFNTIATINKLLWRD